MTGYIFRRLISLGFVLLIVSVLVFFLMTSIPGGPFTLGEHGYTEDALANLNRKYGLDIPVPQRYVNYLSSAIHLDFGNSTSVAGNPPVTELILRVWPVTLQVGLYTIFVAFGFGLTMGFVSAYHRNSWIDNFVTFLSTAGITVPNFIIATWLLLIFGYQVGWSRQSNWIVPPLLGGNLAILSSDYFLPVLTY